MKKFTFLMIALLVASMSFAQTQIQLKGRTAYVPAHKTTQTSSFAKMSRTAIFSEDFEDGIPTGWLNLDEDGDGYTWAQASVLMAGYNIGAYSGEDMVCSQSYDGTAGALTPDNWLITSPIELPNTTDPIILQYYVSAQDGSYAGEHYGVYIYTGQDPEDVSSYTLLGQETMNSAGGPGLTRAQGTWGEKNIDLSSYANQTVYIAFRHFNCTDMFYLDLDNVSISTVSPCTTPLAPNTTDISYTSATLNWTGYTPSYNVRYRTCPILYSNNFDDGLDGWTLVDADNDGYGWVLGSAIGGVYLVDDASLAGYGDEGDMVTSGSYTNYTQSALTPDNWLISPQVELGNLVTFLAKGQDASYYAEHFAIYVSTTGTNPSDFTLISEEFEATSSWTEYSADLSAYNGQGYIAIRHYNCTDMFILDVDNFVVVGAYSDWTTTTATESPLVLNNLTANSFYEWQVQGVCDGSETTDWSSSSLFTTPLPTSILEDVEEAISVYPNPTSSMITVANAEGKNIVVVNSLGQVVANIQNAAANQTIDVANFANGTYFVKVDAEVVKLNVVK